METHRRIFLAVLTVGLFVLLGRIFGALREVMFAARYGTSETIDAYLLVTSITAWLTAVWMSTLTSLAVPLLMRSEAESPRATAAFVSEMSSASLAAGLVLTSLTVAALWYLAGSSWFGLTPRSAEAVREMLAPLSLTLPLGLFISVLSVRLMSQQRHINTLLDGVPALVVSVALLLIVPLSPLALAWTTLLGFVAQACILARLVAPHGPTLLAPRKLESPLWEALSKGLAYFVLGQLAVGAIAFIDPIMVASLGAGTVAALGYANRILALVLGITAMAVARAILPVFAELASDQTRLLRTATSWMIWLFAIGALCTAITWVLAPSLVHLLYERGEFTATDTAIVSSILRFGSLQLPFYLAGIVAVQLLAAQGRNKEITKSGLINVIVKLTANVLLIGAFGVAGAMIATTLMYVVALGFLWRAAVVRTTPSSAAKSG